MLQETAAIGADHSPERLAKECRDGLNCRPYGCLNSAIRRITLPGGKHARHAHQRCAEGGCGRDSPAPPRTVRGFGGCIYQRLPRTDSRIGTRGTKSAAMTPATPATTHLSGRMGLLFLRIIAKDDANDCMMLPETTRNKTFAVSDPRSGATIPKKAGTRRGGSRCKDCPSVLAQRCCQEKES